MLRSRFGIAGLIGSFIVGCVATVMFLSIRPDSSFNLSSGWSEFIDRFGGLGSFLGLLALLISLVLVLGSLAWLAFTKHEEINFRFVWHVVSVLLVIALGLYIWSNWVSLPSGSAWALAGAGCLAGLSFAIAFWMGRRSATATTK